MNIRYYSVMHYCKINSGLLSLLDTNLISSGSFGNQFNFNDNYGGYF